jgi:hypothetical protein
LVHHQLLACYPEHICSFPINLRHSFAHLPDYILPYISLDFSNTDELVIVKSPVLLLSYYSIKTDRPIKFFLLYFHLLLFFLFGFWISQDRIRRSIEDVDDAPRHVCVTLEATRGERTMHTFLAAPSQLRIPFLFIFLFPQSPLVAKLG